MESKLYFEISSINVLTLSNALRSDSNKVKNIEYKGVKQYFL